MLDQLKHLGVGHEDHVELPAEGIDVPLGRLSVSVAARQHPLHLPVAAPHDPHLNYVVGRALSVVSDFQKIHL